MRRLGRIFAYVFWLAGLTLVLYPFVSSWIHGRTTSAEFKVYQETVMTQDWEDELQAAEMLL